MNDKVKETTPVTPVASKIAVTASMKEGKEAPPKGYELVKIVHKPYSYTNAQAKVVEVAGHTENILRKIKVEAPATPAPAPKAEAQTVTKEEVGKVEDVLPKVEDKPVDKPKK